MPRSRKRGNNGSVAASTPSPAARDRSRRESSVHSSPDRPTGPLSIVIPPEERDVIKVNNANLTELKNACDDAVKRFLSRPDLFNQIYLHTDVRLGLGWGSVFVAAGTALYGYKVDFEHSKPVMWVGLIMYIFLSVVQTLYAYLIEGNIIFVGKRKTFFKRIVSERITLSSSSEPADRNKPPAYCLSLSYVRSTNGGKSLLARGKTRDSQPFNQFFDEVGIMHQEIFEAWVGKLVEEAMEGKTS